MANFKDLMQNAEINRLLGTLSKDGAEKVSALFSGEDVDDENLGDVLKRIKDLSPELASDPTLTAMLTSLAGPGIDAADLEEKGPGLRIEVDAISYASVKYHGKLEDKAAQIKRTTGLDVMEEMKQANRLRKDELINDFTKAIASATTLDFRQAGDKQDQILAGIAVLLDDFRKNYDRFEDICIGGNGSNWTGARNGAYLALSRIKKEAEFAVSYVENLAEQGLVSRDGLFYNQMTMMNKRAGELMTAMNGHAKYPIAELSITNGTAYEPVILANWLNADAIPAITELKKQRDANAQTSARPIDKKDEPEKPNLTEVKEALAAFGKGKAFVENVHLKVMPDMPKGKQRSMADEVDDGIKLASRIATALEQGKAPASKDLGTLQQFKGRIRGIHAELDGKAPDQSVADGIDKLARLKDVLDMLREVAEKKPVRPIAIIEPQKIVEAMKAAEPAPAPAKPTAPAQPKQQAPRNPEPKPAESKPQHTPHKHASEEPKAPPAMERPTITPPKQIVQMATRAPARAEPAKPAVAEEINAPQVPVTQPAPAPTSVAQQTEASDAPLAQTRAAATVAPKPVNVTKVREALEVLQPASFVPEVYAMLTETTENTALSEALTKRDMDVLNITLPALDAILEKAERGSELTPDDRKQIAKTTQALNRCFNTVCNEIGETRELMESQKEDDYLKPLLNAIKALEDLQQNIRSIQR